MQELWGSRVPSIVITADHTQDAQTAAKWGLINRVVPKADLMSTAFSIARRVAANAPLAVQAAKELAIRAQDMDLATGLRWEQMTNRLLQTSRDVHEGVKAFAEKRAPDFRAE